MNPAIVIPTYWAQQEGQPGSYDHATSVDAPSPELARCLDSLEQVRGVMRTIVLVAAPPAAQREARARVDAICSEHPHLSPLVVGEAEARAIKDAVAVMAPRLPGEAVSLRGYGAIRNLGLAVAAVLGHDVVVYMDDDEIALGPEFLVEGVYGLGQLTRQGTPILAKSGCFIDAEGSVYANEKLSWTDKRWDKNIGFNQWMRRAQGTVRISRSNHLCGGCFAVHAEAFSRVAFDPYITRGEDLDYLFNLRMYGYEVWFDNQWRVQHLPPATPLPAKRFRQNVYRWVYEQRKLAAASRRPDLVQVTPSSLMPYPGAYLQDDLDKRVRTTARRRAVAGSTSSEDRAEYLSVWRSGLADAEANAERHERSYLQLQSWWPSIVSGLWQEPQLGAHLLAQGSPCGLPQPPEPGAHTGPMPVMPEEPVAAEEPAEDEPLDAEGLAPEEPEPDGLLVDPDDVVPPEEP